MQRTHFTEVWTEKFILNSYSDSVGVEVTDLMDEESNTHPDQHRQSGTWTVMIMDKYKRLLISTGKQWSGVEA